MTISAEHHARIQVAAQLQGWFEEYAKLDDDPPRDTGVRGEWWRARFAAWNGVRNLSRHLGEWAERNAPQVDPPALVELGGTACPLGPFPAALLKRAWVSARRLQALIGTLNQTVADGVIDAMGKAQLETPPSPNGTRAPTAAKAKRVPVNERMMITLAKNPEAASWSVQQWADALDCAKSTVQVTGQWKALREAHCLAKIEKIEEKERRRGLMKKGIDRRKLGRNVD